MTRPVPVLSMALVWLWAVPALAQDSRDTEPPAHVSYVDGSVVLERDGRADAEPLSMPLLAGDRLRTGRGRVEVLFADGSALHLDGDTVVDFQSDDVLRLIDGRLRLTVSGPARDAAYRVDTASAWVQISDPGEYRVAVLRDGEVELAILRGAAELVNEQGRTYIRAGERTFARAGSAPSPPYIFNSAAWDPFDQWSESRREERLGASARYLPSDVRPYARVLDTYGSWRHEPAYGYVWYPRVHTSWRPYHRGRWASLRPFGWTWVAADPWGWPTHHYGRWGISAGAWFWIPGRTWGPAWVSWAYAPDYVSWCPLGWNDGPVVQIVNIYGGGYRGYDPWRAWSVVPRRHFAGPYVNVTNITSVRVDARTERAFVVRGTAPEVRYAVGRPTPIRSAGRYAVPRSAGAALPDRSAAAAGASPEATASRERRFPPAARVPRMSSPGRAGTTSPSTVGDTSRARRSGAPEPVQPGASAAQSGLPSRATPRVQGADPGPWGSRARTPSDRARDGGDTTERGAEYTRVPTARGRPAGGELRSGEVAAPVTAPPAGAVRAIPRVRPSEERLHTPTAPSRRGTWVQPSTPPPADSQPPVFGSSEGRAPRAVPAPPRGSLGARPPGPPPAVSRPTVAGPQEDGMAGRPMPGYRSAPRAEDGFGSRGGGVPRAVPRGMSAPPPRPAPPGGRIHPRPPAGPPPAPAGTPGGLERGGGRQRSGESTGQGRRRQ